MKGKPQSKTSKRKCSYEKRQVTLDSCHQQRVDEFKAQYDQYNVKDLHANILTLQSKENRSDIDDTELAGLIQNLASTTTTIYEDEVDYYTKTAEILYNYYDAVENQASLRVAAKPQQAITSSSSANSSGSGANSKSILDFFAMSERTRTASAPTSSSSSSSSSTNSTSEITLAYRDIDSQNKSMLYDRYLCATDSNYVKADDSEDHAQCEHCQSLNTTMLVQEGMIYCNECFTVRVIVIDNDKPSYKEPQKEISYLNYKRKNHFNEWLNQIQGKETTDIPEEIFNSILLEIKKLKVTNMADLNHAKIREILKKLKANRFYEHTPYIYYRITGIPNQYLSAELEEKLRNMFEQIQVPFLKHSPASRKNFLSYSYVIHKMLQLLGEDRYLCYFPLLKNREKLHQQEQIWTKICEELQWQLIRSI
jgi:hypothetical protein